MQICLLRRMHKDCSKHRQLFKIQMMKTQKKNNDNSLDNKRMTSSTFLPNQSINLSIYLLVNETIRTSNFSNVFLLVQMLPGKKKQLRITDNSHSDNQPKSRCKISVNSYTICILLTLSIKIPKCYTIFFHTSAFLG